MAYEELSEPWVVPVIGDWVTDKRGKVWRIKGVHKEQGVLCVCTTPSGRTGRSYKDMAELTKLDDSLGKILTAVNKEK
jgi:hypothetical protein